MDSKLIPARNAEGHTHTHTATVVLSFNESTESGGVGNCIF